MRKTNSSTWVGVIALTFGPSLIAQAQSWSYAGSTANRRASYTATLLSNGEFLVAFAAG